jgi:hypothetical protein
MKLSQLGNVNQFGSDVVMSIGYTLLLGYFGGSMTSLCKTKTLSSIFPTHPNRVPYAPSGGANVNGLMELLWPMQSVGLPYTWIQPSTNVTTLSLSLVWDWLARSCRDTFISTRWLWITIIRNVCIPYLDSILGDMFVFYILPHIMVAIVSLPIVALVAWIVVCMNAFQHGGYIHILAGFIYPCIALQGKQTYGAGAFLSAGIWSIIGWCLIPLYLMWWTGVAAAVWGYMAVFVYFTPFMFTNGVDSTLREMKAHKLSLLCTFMSLILLSSMKSLNHSITTGITVMAVYMVYTLLR